MKGQTGAANALGYSNGTGPNHLMPAALQFDGGGKIASPIKMAWQLGRAAEDAHSAFELVTLGVRYSRQRTARLLLLAWVRAHVSGQCRRGFASPSRRGC